MSEVENKETEIDLLALLSTLWDNKKKICLICIIAIIIGGIFAFSKPKEYTTTISFTASAPQGGISGNMGMLASFAGINMPTNTNDGISPELYSEILKSTVFIEQCLSLPVRDDKQNINTTLSEYLLDYQKQSWIISVIKSPLLLLNIFSSKSDGELLIEENNDPRYISRSDMNAMNALKNSYSISIDKKTNLITFNLTAQSPVISAFLADTITSKLQSFLIDYKIKKSQEDLLNAELLLKQAEEKYNQALIKSAEFEDRNKNVVLAQYLIKQKELQNELNLTYGVYNQMAQQVQGYKIAILDQKPVFSIIQPAIEPLTPSAPNKKLIIIGFAFLGFIGSCLWVLRKDLMEIVKG